MTGNSSFAGPTPATTQGDTLHPAGRGQHSSMTGYTQLAGPPPATTQGDNLHTLHPAGRGQHSSMTGYTQLAGPTPATAQGDNLHSAGMGQHSSMTGNSSFAGSPPATAQGYVQLTAGPTPASPANGSLLDAGRGQHSPTSAGEGGSATSEASTDRASLSSVGGSDLDSSSTTLPHEGSLHSSFQEGTSGLQTAATKEALATSSPTSTQRDLSQSSGVNSRQRTSGEGTNPRRGSLPTNSKGKSAKNGIQQFLVRERRQAGSDNQSTSNAVNAQLRRSDRQRK
jgi:hypothetical protein